MWNVGSSCECIAFDSNHADIATIVNDKDRSPFVPVYEGLKRVIPPLYLLGPCSFHMCLEISDGDDLSWTLFKSSFHMLS